jgi:hypothetical protein
MSFYGKKALIEWGYTTECQTRYEKSNTQIKKKILECWYPIGMNVKLSPIGMNVKLSSYQLPNPVYTIISHNENVILLKDKNENTKIILNPIVLTPTESSMRSIKREGKFRQLGLE